MSLKSLPGPSVDPGVAGVLGAGSALGCRVLQGGRCRGQGGTGWPRGSGSFFLLFGRHLNIKIYTHADIFNTKCDFNFHELRQTQICNKTGKPLYQSRESILQQAFVCLCIPR